VLAYRGMKRRLVLAFTIFLLSLIGAGIYFVVNKAPEQDQQSVSPRQASYRDSAIGLEVKYPEQTAKAQTLTDADKKDKIMLRLTGQEGQLPMLVTLRSESGLRVVANLTKASIIDILMSNSEKALPQRFTGYKEESRRRYEHNGRNAGEIIFTYNSPVEGERVKQRFVVFVKDDNTAVYLAMQAKEVDFDEQNAKLFQPMAESLGFE